MIRIESLLSARLFLAPQLVDDRLFFISNLSGRLSLYAMDYGGSVPEPLLPPHLALQNPDLVGGYAFYVFPRLGQILVMLDNDGDEKYQPMLIPISGGFPEPAFGTALEQYQVFCTHCDKERNLVYFSTNALAEQRTAIFRGDLTAQTLELLHESRWGSGVGGFSADHTRVLIGEGYTFSDTVLFERLPDGERRLLHGTPIEARAEGQSVPTSSIRDCHYIDADRGLLFVTSRFDDAYGLAAMDLAPLSDPQPVTITGTIHSGAGELTGLEHLEGDRYQVSYNIDGCSWLYTGRFDAAARALHLDTVVCGAGPLAGGVMESAFYDKASRRYSLAFSTATSPAQIYTVAGDVREAATPHTRERVLGIPPEWLAPGEDASFTSFDGLRISARLYRPAPALGFAGPRPLVYYIHGGPQSQERPDFAWFSMPLIQFLTMNGFAVFVPNARGSSGYGQRYMKYVDRDWGGADRRDHVHALTETLPHDPLIDTRRAGVVGRSYGGYMTLTLATRHPELWSAAVDMFGPYDLTTFTDRIPEAWKPYFALAVGDPVKDRDFLVERSPRAYIEQIACPLLVIQGQNDPRVIERESRDVVEHLRAMGKTVDYLLFDNEGHDVLKFENRVRCYNAITAFFTQHLTP